MIAARGFVPKGQWGACLRRNCEIGERQARRYIALTPAYQTSGHSVPDLASLSFRGLMRHLTPPRRQQQVNSAPRRHSNPTTITHEKLNSLVSANASAAERASFISGIGWQSLAEAIPPGWLAVAQQWLQQTHRPNAAITVDQNSSVLLDDLSIPTFLRRDPSTKSEVVS